MTLERSAPPGLIKSVGHLVKQRCAILALNENSVANVSMVTSAAVIERRDSGKGIRNASIDQASLAGWYRA